MNNIKKIGVVFMDLPKHLNALSKVQDLMQTLPILREPRDGIDDETSIVCHASDFFEALSYYQKKSSYAPTFYVSGELQETVPHKIHVRPFSELAPNMKIQLYFRQSNAPYKTPFRNLALDLHAKGFVHYYLEKFCTEKFYARDARFQYNERGLNVIMNFYNKLEDQASKYAYLAVCKARQEAEPGYIPMAPYEQYWHPLIKAEMSDYFCEGGPADGGTTIDFSKAVGSEGKIFAFEPFSQAYQVALKNLQAYNNVCLEEKALWERSEKLNLNITTFQFVSPLNQDEDMENYCKGVSIDDYFANKRPLNAIKLDVEGAEMPVLRGAMKTIIQHKPKLIISIYHRQNGNDFLNIPELLMALPCDYKFYVGHHRPWYNETILYGIYQ